MSDNREINFRYVFPENYNPVYCNGAYGGVSTQGEIVMNFYLERMPIPNSVTHQVGEDGALAGVIATDPEDLNKKVIRYVSNGVVLSETGARAVYNWLGAQICELENRKNPPKDKE